DPVVAPMSTATAVTPLSYVATAVPQMKKSSKNLVRTAITVVISSAVPPLSISDRLSSPSANRVKKSIPTARTSATANGSLISGSGCLLATARAAATIVAVAPTLDATSQLSAAVRASTL